MNGVAANRTGRSSVGARRHVRAALPLLLSLADNRRHSVG